MGEGSVVRPGARAPTEPAGKGADGQLGFVLVRERDRASRDAEFSVFMRDAQPQLARMAWLLTADRHRAEELVQQALVKTYVAWNRARSDNPLAYARRILANTRIDTWRRRRREVLVPGVLDDSETGPVIDAGSSYADRDLLVRALAQLPVKRRRAVVLRYLMDLSEEQAAAELGVSTGAVKSASSRGLAQLRHLLGTNEEVRS